MESIQHYQNQGLLRRGDTDALLPRSQTEPSGAACLHQFLDPEEFEILLIPFEKAEKDYINRYYIHKKSRKRRYGGGRKPHLVAIEDKLLFILFYFKVYPLQAVIARIFGMSQGRANEWIDKLTPILESALGEAQCLPERDPQNLEQVLALCVAVDFMIDGTERSTYRPTDPIEQKDQYSGKKKQRAGKRLKL